MMCPKCWRTCWRPCRSCVHCKSAFGQWLLHVCSCLSSLSYSPAALASPDLGPAGAARRQPATRQLAHRPAVPGPSWRHDCAQHCCTRLSTAAAALQWHLVALQPRDRGRLNDAPGYADWHPGAVQWAASHPSLRCLDMEVPSRRFPNQPGLGTNFESVNAAAMRRNPALQIRTESGLTGLALEELIACVVERPG